MVAVAGASGHVGGNLVRLLLARGHAVRAVVRSDRRALEGLKVDIRTGDITDPQFALESLQSADTVYHLASGISILGDRLDRVEAINVGGVQAIIHACRANGVQRLVHFSTVHALADDPRDAPTDESRQLVEGPRVAHYSRTKAEGERLVPETVRGGWTQCLSEIRLSVSVGLGTLRSC